MKTTLTIEESARLIELGVDPKLASKKEFVDIHPEVLKGNAEYARPWGWFPRFTLADILSILPKEIEFINRDDTGCHFRLGIEWNVSLKEWAVGCGMYKSAPELIDALYQLLIWMLENNYV